MHHIGQITAVIQQHIGVPRLTIFKDGLFNTPVTLFNSLTFPGVNRDTFGGDVCCSVILR